MIRSRVLERGLLLIIGLHATSCTVTPQEPNRAEGAYRALRMLQGATSVGVSFPRYGELVQSLAGEILILRDHARSSRERYVANQYAIALADYKDAYELWSQKIDDAKYSFIPEGKIIVSGKLEDVVRRQGIATETLKGFPMISDTWTQRLWERAELASAPGDSVMLGLKEIRP